MSSISHIDRYTNNVPNPITADATFLTGNLVIMIQKKNLRFYATYLRLEDL